MRVLRLGIAGGCLSHQPGIPFSRLYHQLLSRMLQEAYEVKLRPVIDGSFDAPLDERLAALADRQADLVLVHVRSVITIGSTAVYRRKPLLPSDDPAGRPIGPRVFGSRETLHPDWMHEGNLALGVLVGRHRRVSAEQVREAIAATATAARRAVMIVVMGPTGVVRGPADRLVCETLNSGLSRASRTHGFQFVDVLQGWDRAFCLPDGTHLTAEGHRHVADQLFATIGPRLAAGDTEAVPAIPAEPAARGGPVAGLAAESDGVRAEAGAGASWAVSCRNPRSRTRGDGS